ncbi:MAG: gamma-glutamyl-gamma-aminobutyrate hydrolase family protein [Actinobacteria bacterium]|nr:gamma-glutamyl-gamma-aminobutyrate hydrolase family protein [Actinomycetota bacterium]
MNTENSTPRPRIGLTSGRAGVPVTEGALQSYYVGRNYVRAVILAGGAPLIFPAVEEEVEAVVDAALAVIDGLVLPGGCDLSPALYGGDEGAALDADPIRDAFELAMLRGALEREIPVLGVCRGMELINVYRGGSLRDGVSHPAAQDIHVDALGRVRVHDVNVLEGTLAYQVFGRNRVEATCVHHQAPGAIGAGLIASVLADDGSIEAVEDPEHELLGLIWHPELGLERTPTHQLPYDWVVERARIAGAVR